MFLTKKCILEQVKHFALTTQQTNSNGPIPVKLQVYIHYCLMVYMYSLFKWNALVEY